MNTSMNWFSRSLLFFSLLLMSSCAVRWQGRELIGLAVEPTIGIYHAGIQGTNALVPARP